MVGIVEHRGDQDSRRGVSGPRSRYGMGPARLTARGPVAPLEAFYGPLVEAPELPACPACGGTACRGCGAVALDLFTGEEVLPLITLKKCADPSLFD